jgi:adenosylmethionine-8-amino-7-oxononanoate aminotransferase
MFGPLLFDVLRIASPNVHALPAEVTPENACSHYLRQLEQLLSERHDDIAAVVIEPLVQGAAGMIMHPEGYLRGVRQLTRKYHLLLIADEIVTAFGRTGRMFACEREDVVPDLMCLGKGITGGYLPLAATLATETVYNAFLGPSFPDPGENQKTFFHGHTYGGNPIACAASLATIDLLENEYVQNAAEVGEYAMDALEEIKSRHPSIGDVRGRGLMMGVDFVKDRQTREPDGKLRSRVERLGFEYGLITLGCGKSTIRLAPPLSISKAEIDEGFKILDHVIGLAETER